jgi:thiamine pyrophosphate-dependent acetolactate synthase large subunit-like protein
MITRRQAIETIFEDVADGDLVLCATGMISREAFGVRDRPANFYMIGSMGLLSSFGLGLALMSPDQRVIVLDGDGSVLMGLGTLPLLASEAPLNLLHIVLDNEAYQSTGGQPSISSTVSIADIGEASGYPSSIEVNSVDGIRSALTGSHDVSGPHFVVVKVANGPVEHIPRVSHSPTEIRDRFKSQVQARG